jgi:acyl-coenzyme A synthetase/AMP-(fatty) acid ligase
MLLSQIRQTASRHRSRSALREGDVAVTYGKLTDLIERRAESLRGGERGRWSVAGAGGIETVVTILAARHAALGVVVIAPDVPEKLALRRRTELAAWRPPESCAATIFYSSGSVGPGRAIPLDDDRLLAAASAYRGDGEIRAADRVGLVSSPAHVFGFVRGCLDPLTVGAEVVFLPAARDVIARAGSAGVSLLLAPARHLALASRTRSGAPLRGILTGGSSVPESVIRRIETGRGVPVRVGYGTTETAGIGSRQRLNRARRPGTAGLPPPGTSVTIEDGEIVIAGPSVFDEYAGTPSGNELDHRGQFRTGDLGELDIEGELIVFGRRQFSIDVRGRRVCAEEVEAAVAEHGGVLEAAAVPFGDAFVLLIVAADASPELSSDLLRHLRGRLPEFARPRSIRLVEELPRTASGKLDRAAAQELL